MKINEIFRFLEQIAPLSYQENYDNSGLIVGDANSDFVKGIVCLDVSESVLDEAIANNCNLIISHHPLVFQGLKKITHKTAVERILIKAIKNNIVIYAIHTNIDNVIQGVNSCFADKLQLENKRILQTKKQLLKKIVTFVPFEHADTVRSSLFEAGCGFIGNYDSCSYNIEGNGTFRANEQATPFTGEMGKLHIEKEIRIETIFPAYKENNVIAALLRSHPYEEVAYDIYSLDNHHPQVGSGMIGSLPKAMNEKEFLAYLKNKMKLNVIQHSKFTERKIQKVALCGGSGNFLINDAIAQQADVFITGEIRYHDFLTHENDIFLNSIGHYESEIEIKHYLVEKLVEKFTTFVGSKTETNPIGYFS